MKQETYFKKAMEIENINIRLAKLETIGFKFTAGTEFHKMVLNECKKLRKQGAKYW